MHIYKYAYHYVFFSSSISNLHNDIIHLQISVIDDEENIDEVIDARADDS